MNAEELNRQKKSAPLVRLGDGYIEETDERNTDGIRSIRDVYGVSIQKELIETKADMTNVSLSSYKILRSNEFVFVPVTSRNGGKISLAANLKNQVMIVSSSYITFKIKDAHKCLPEYLFLQFKRPEFDRYARFHSWGSARETFNWEDMCRVKIPLPPIEVQKAIANLWHCAEEARKIADEAKEQLAQLCPALIQHASRNTQSD